MNPFPERAAALEAIAAAERAMVRTARDPIAFARHKRDRDAALVEIERLDFVRLQQRQQHTKVAS